MRLWYYKLLVIVTVGWLLGVARADAESIQLRVTDGTTSVTISDNGPGDAAGMLTGAISWTGSVGAWNLVVDVGTGSAVLGPGHMDLTYNATSTSGTGSALTMILSQTGTTPSFPGWGTSIGGTLNGGITSVSYSAYASSSNSFFACSPINPGIMCDSAGTQIGSTLTATSSPYALTNGGPISGLTTPYSLTEVLRIQGNGNAPAQATGDATLTPVPEPTTLALMGAGLVGLVMVKRKRSKIQPPAVSL